MAQFAIIVNCYEDEISRTKHDKPQDESRNINLLIIAFVSALFYQMHFKNFNYRRLDNTVQRVIRGVR